MVQWLQHLFPNICYVFISFGYNCGHPDKQLTIFVTWVDNVIIFQTTIGRGRGRPVGLLGDSPGFGPQQPYTGGYNQMVDHSYDPYENASYGGGYNYGQDLASKFGAMSLGNNMAGGDNVQNRVMNPHTGKLYIRKQGKSHYKMPLNKWIGIQWINPCRAELILGIIKRYLHFPVFLDIVLPWVPDVLTHGREGPVYPTWSIPWLLMPWWRKEPGQQQPWYWPSSPGIFQFQHHKGTAVMISSRWRTLQSNLATKGWGLLTLYVLPCFKETLINLHLLSFLNMWKMLQSFLMERKDLFSTQSISLLLMTWRLVEPGHQQAWYWPSSPQYSDISSWRVKVLFVDYSIRNISALANISARSIEFVRHHHIWASATPVKYECDIIG